MRSNRDHIECVGCRCGGSDHVVVDWLVIDGSALTFWNSAAGVCGVCHKCAVRRQARVHSASSIASVVVLLGVHADTSVIAAIIPGSSLYVNGVISVSAHILWSGDLWGYCLVGDSHWSDGSAGLGFGGGLTLVTFGSLAAGVVGVLFVSTIPWKVIVLWARVSALVLSSTSIQTFTCQLAAILPSVILMVDFAFVYTCSTSAIDEGVERVVGSNVGLATKAWVLDWVGIEDWAGGGASGESRRHGRGNVAIGYHAAWIVLIGDQSAGVRDLVELWASRSAAVEIVGDIITSTNFVTAILPALSLSVVHTLVHTESIGWSWSVASTDR